MQNARRKVWTALSLTAGLALAFALTALPAAAQSTNQHWVSTWMTAPMAGNWADGFQDQTVRMIVHTSIAGNRLRVELTNAFGEHSLIIGAAHVALQAKGASIQPGSDRALTFDGSPSITIPPGAPAVSDPVDLRVPALANLAISIYVPNKTGPATVHPLGLHTTYISGPGNFVAAQDMASSWTTSSYYWITAVDVEAGPQASAIVALGDSITDGAHSTLNANAQWPSQLAARLQANPATAHLAVVNAGISGNRILHDVSGPSALARFDRDVLARNGVKYVIVLEGINDLGFPHEHGAHGTQEDTALQLIEGLQQIVQRAHTHGIKVFGATLTPYQGAVYSSQEGETKREAINRWIRTSGVLDGVVDFDAAVRDPKQPLRYLPAYDSGDHLHPGDAGYKAMADAVNLSLFH